MSDSQNEKTAEDGARVKQFLDDPAIRGALQTLKDKFYGEFTASAGTPDRLLAAYAKAKALDELANELVVLVNRGIQARVEMDRQRNAKPNAPKK